MVALLLMITCFASLALCGVPDYGQGSVIQATAIGLTADDIPGFDGQVLTSTVNNSLSGATQATAIPTTIIQSGSQNFTSTIDIPVSTAASLTTITQSDGQVFTTTNSVLISSTEFPETSPTVVLSTSTDSNGGVATASSTLLSTQISGPSTTTLPSATPTDLQVTIRPDLTASGDASAIIIGSTTMTPGGLAFTTDVCTVSLGSSGILNVCGSTTSLAIQAKVPSGPSTSTTSSGNTLSASDITSTMTTVPSGVSTEIIQPPDITTNSWITTSRDDSSTISGTFRQFQTLSPTGPWSFPSLPKFSLPCIKIFGSVVAGDCPNPQTNENNDDDSGDNDDDDDGDISSTTSSSSTEICTQSTTVTDCKVGCSVSSTSTGGSVSSTTICYTTSCTQNAGCNLAGTTSSTIPTPSSALACAITGSPSSATVRPETDISEETESDLIDVPPSISSDPPTTSSLPSTSELTTFSTLPSLPVWTSLPALSTGVGSSSGSICASTTTFSQCAGSGGQQACVDTSSCASWVATDTTTPTPTPTPEPEPEPTTTTSEPEPIPTQSITPLEVISAECFDEADFPGHADIQGSDQSTFSDYFCNDWNDFFDGQSDIGPGEAVADLRVDGYGVNDWYEISWVDGCVTTVDRQDVLDPLGEGGETCKDIVTENYRRCSNGGVGGRSQAGCLLFSFTGGE
ncbi:unnamed protein product [Zymoseptoria tritici ST99CH_3D1]|nr:unnamed protein product [Zymoseptoria tritici ST99CH_3D1]